LPSANNLKMKNGFVYILRSLKNGTFYIGSTTDINRRLHQHKIGSTKATRYLLPLKLELSQRYNNIDRARSIERKLKKLKRKDYIEKIIKDRVIIMGSDVPTKSSKVGAPTYSDANIRNESSE